MPPEALKASSTAPHKDPSYRENLSQKDWMAFEIALRMKELGLDISPEKTQQHATAIMEVLEKLLEHKAKRSDPLLAGFRYPIPRSLIDAHEKHTTSLQQLGADNVHSGVIIRGPIGYEGWDAMPTPLRVSLVRKEQENSDESGWIPFTHCDLATVSIIKGNMNFRCNKELYTRSINPDVPLFVESTVQ